MQTSSTGRRVGFADQVYAQLRRLIQRGEYPVNSRLPPEQELGGRFGVSRPVIRQALRRLAEEGVVETRKCSGTIVRIGRLALQAGFPPLTSVADMQQFYEFRIDVEGRTAALAAMRHAPAHLAEIEEALLRSEQAIAAGNLRVGADLNFSFHRAIARASGNRFHQALLDGSISATSRHAWTPAGTTVGDGGRLSRTTSCTRRSTSVVAGKRGARNCHRTSDIITS